MTLEEIIANKKIDKCPFCNGNAKVSYKDYQFVGKNYVGDKKTKYRVQVICNRCKSRGKPIITDALINPNPRALLKKEQADMFEPYLKQAIEAWNRRTNDKQIPKKPLPENEIYGNGICPNCGAYFMDKSTKFCGNCGQALDWNSNE